MTQQEILLARKKAEQKRKIQSGFFIALTLVLMLLFMSPLYISVVTSFKTKPELAQSVIALPKGLNWANYREAMERSNFLRSLLNSCVVTFPSVMLLVIMASMGGYAIARFGKMR